MFSAIWNVCKSIVNRGKDSIKQWIKLTTVTLAVGAVQDLSRSKSDLIVENAILRQQLIILKRSVKRPKFTEADRVRLTLLARLTKFWQSASLSGSQAQFAPWFFLVSYKRRCKSSVALSNRYYMIQS